MGRGEEFGRPRTRSTRRRSFKKAASAPARAAECEWLTRSIFLGAGERYPDHVGAAVLAGSLAVRRNPEIADNS
jgi:hypothetical protein